MKFSRTFILLSVFMSTIGCKPASKPRVVAGPQVSAAASTPVKLQVSLESAKPAIGGCGLLNIQLSDVDGFGSFVSVETKIQLSSSAPTVTFFSDPDCTVPIKETVIPPESYSASVAFRSTVAEAVTLTAAPSAGSLVAGTLEVAAGVISKVALVGIFESSSLVSSICNGLGVETQNSTGERVVPAQDLEVALRTSTSTGGFYSDAECTVPVQKVVVKSGFQSFGAELFYKDSAKGSVTLSASEAPSKGYGAASVTFQLVAE